MVEGKRKREERTRHDDERKRKKKGGEGSEYIEPNLRKICCNLLRSRCFPSPEPGETLNSILEGIFIHRTISLVPVPLEIQRDLHAGIFGEGEGEKTLVKYCLNKSLEMSILPDTRIAWENVPQDKHEKKYSLRRLFEKHLRTGPTFCSTFNLLAVGFLEIRPAGFQTARALLARHSYKWEDLQTDLKKSIKKLSDTSSVGYHGLNPKTCKKCKGRPLGPDRVIADQSLQHLISYFSSSSSPQDRCRDRDHSADNCFQSYELPSVPDLPKVILFDDDEDTEILLKHQSDLSGWQTLYPSQIPPAILKQFESDKFTLHLDSLRRENLLKIHAGNVYFKSKSGRHDMFFLQKVGTDEEIFEMSILQALAVSFNLLLKASLRHKRGWSLIPTGFHKDYLSTPIEFAFTKNLRPVVCDMLDSLVVGYSVFEYRFQKWAVSISGNLNLFKEQILAIEENERNWGSVFPRPNVSLSRLQVVRNFWFGVGRGTCMHKDGKNVGISIAYYLGFDWGGHDDQEGSGGVGLPEKQFLWNHGPGSVMGIRAWKYFHMSCPPREGGLKIMGAGYINKI